MKRRRWIGTALVLGLGAFADASAQVASTATAPTFNFESGPTRQLLVSETRRELYLLNTADHRLEIYRYWKGATAPSGGPRRVFLRHRASVFTGLEPVSMALDPAKADYLYVANHVSDSVAVVNLSAAAVQSIIPVGDEPRDVALANGKLYVACARIAKKSNPEEFRDHVVLVHEAGNRFRRLKTLEIDGHKPRAFCVDGDHLYVVPTNSGNHTTLLTESEAVSMGLTQLDLDAFDTNFVLNEVLAETISTTRDGWNIPDTSRIVFDSEFPALVPQLDDHDIIAIDTTDDLVEAAKSTGVGTTLFHIAKNPVSGDFWIANTDANNRIRQEYAINGATVRNLVTVVESSPGGNVIDQVELAPPFTSRHHAQPHFVAFYQGASGDYAYVASLGSPLVTILDAGTRGFVAELPVGDICGGLAVDDDGFLFAYSRDDKQIRVFDVEASHAEVGASRHTPYDAELPLVAAGRRLLYGSDPALGSGNGNTSCATCHVFGDTDGMSWDLGNSQGALSYFFPDTAQGPGSFLQNRVLARTTTEVQNPMKGPLTTQTLRGIVGDLEPFHWRGDRRFLHNFQSAFEGLQAGSGVSDQNMQEFVAFVDTIDFPPNPRQRSDRTYTGAAARGRELFGMPPFTGKNYALFAGNLKCVTCHTADFENDNFTGSSPFMDDEGLLQMFNTGQLRGIYDKEYRELTGFGTHHDGAHDGVVGFLDAVVFGFDAFDLLTDQDMADLSSFLNAWDSGISPLVGDQAHFGPLQPTLFGGRDVGFLKEAEFQAQPPKSWVDLIGKGWRFQEGAFVPLGMVYQFDTGTAQWRYRLDDDTWADRDDLLDAIEAGLMSVTFTAVPPGTGVRLGVDRDEDGLFDGLERALGTNPAKPDSDGDGYGDHAELALAGDPKSFDAILNDVTSPTVDSHEIKHLFVSSGTLVVETDEPTTLSVAVTPSGDSAILFTSDELRRIHQVVLLGLPAGTSHSYTVDAFDRNANSSQVAGSFTTVVPHLHVESIELTRLQNNPVILEAKFKVADRAGNPVAGVPVNGRLAGDIGANANTFQVVTDAAGEAVHQLAPYTPGSADTVTVGLDFLGSLAPAHPFFVGRGGGTSNFFYEQSFNKSNYATVEVF